MHALRTPDERFRNLPSYPFEPRYVEIPEANRAAWRALERCEKPFLCAFSDADPITAAGHFLQEDKGEELARVVVDLIRRTSPADGS